MLFFAFPRLVLARVRRAFTSAVPGEKRRRSLCLNGRLVAVFGALLVAGIQAEAGAATTTTTLSVTSGGVAVTTVASGSVVTLTATVTAGSTPVTVGQVNFCDATAKSCTDIHLLGLAQLTKAGTAILKFRPGVGSHSYKAAFLGTPNGTLSTAASTSVAAALTVTGLFPTATIIEQAGNPGDYTLMATVGGTGSAAPTGTISFLNASDGNAVLGMAALTNGTAGLIFLNRSSFSVAGIYTSTYVIAVGDFNGDGIPDIAVANSAGCLTGYCWDAGATVFLGDGQGNFTAAATSDLGINIVVTYVAVGDFNGDGILDLAVGSSNAGTVMILMGKGDGTFSAGGSVATGGTFQSFAVGDFNGDGIPDLAVLNTTADMVFLFLGNGDGTFTPSSSATSATGSNPVSATVGDFNGDGILDLAVVNECGSDPSCKSDGTLTILLGNGNGTFTTAASPAVGLEPASIAMGDFNGDGIQDLAVAYYDGSAVSVLLGKGNGTFAPSSDSSTGHQVPGSFIAAGDFNGDATADLVLGSTADATVLLGNGDGTFTLRQLTTVPPPVNNNFIAVGDFNGDGRTDVVESGNVLLTATETSTATATGIGVPVATGTQQVAASYPGDGNYKASTSGATSLSAAQGTPIVSLTASPNPATPGSSVTLTATVTGTGLTPTGTVTFYAGSRLLGTATLNSSGVATFATSSLATGMDSLTANYGGDANYVAANSPAIIVSVTNLLTPTVTVTPSSSSITTAQALTVTVAVSGGTGNPTPTGSVILSGGGYASAATALSGGSAQISIPAGSLSTGNDKLTASYTPDSNSSSTYNSASGANSVTVNPAPSFTLAPTAASLTVVQGSSNTDTITVTGANGFTGSVTLSASGLPSGVTASFGTNPATGSSMLTLTATNAATVGGPVTVTINGISGTLTAFTTIALTVNAAPTFVVGGGSSSISIVPGATTGNTVMITVTPANGFTGTVNLTCSISPVAANDPATCSLSPNSVTITGSGAQTSTLTVMTTAATTAENQLKKLLWPSAGTALALLLVGLPRRRRNWPAILGVLALSIVLGAMGCGGGGGNSGVGGGGGGNAGTTPGTYTVTVTGTSGSITGTVGTVTLTVQ
jgi:hypothetical protein